MPRIALGIEYDGSAFAGWQAQNACPRRAVGGRSSTHRQVADHPVAVVAAGRTDAGVHAAMQVVHFDTTAVRTRAQLDAGRELRLAARGQRAVGA